MIVDWDRSSSKSNRFSFITRSWWVNRIHQSLMEVWPPGGARTLEVGRPVRTFGPFPDAKALLDTASFVFEIVSVV